MQKRTSKKVGRCRRNCVYYMPSGDLHCKFRSVHIRPSSMALTIIVSLSKCTSFVSQIQLTSTTLCARISFQLALLPTFPPSFLRPLSLFVPCVPSSLSKLFLTQMTSGASACNLCPIATYSAHGGKLFLPVPPTLSFRSRFAQLATSRGVSKVFGIVSAFFQVPARNSQRAKA